MNTSSFKIYNASAGSGKTYSLVKEYIKILLKSNRQEPYKYILAITFTNKAAAEMKDRIIYMLQQFAEEDIINSSNHMFRILCGELDYSPLKVHEKSKQLLNNIINNYASFNVSTIDGFLHRIIRTFAYDLRLPINFDVELDQEELLTEAVNSLIAKAGTDKTLTKVLINFAKEKINEDKSWDVSYDFNNIAQLLLNETDKENIESFKDKSLNDFSELKSDIKKQIQLLDNYLVEQAQLALSLIETNGIQFSDFNRGYLPKYFKKILQKDFNISYDPAWQSDLIEGRALYPKRVSSHIAGLIDSIQPKLISFFNDTKKGVFKHKFLNAIKKNITPLSVISAIRKELELIKIDKNKLLISEFNALIYDQIKDQPTPFIYERLGEKFKHYFIDEFQDTSLKQWENLIPLIDNALSSEGGSTMLVGDAKQSIYRWRGGKPEQFIDLYNKDHHPFQIEQDVMSLDHNYRSYSEIVNFNNSFFNFLAETSLNLPSYKDLYHNSSQTATKTEAGYVNLQFLSIEKEQDKHEIYPEAVLQTITSCLQNGYNLNDICVLVRRKQEGVAVSNYLSEHGISILSSETLLLEQSEEVLFINNTINFLLNPLNDEVKIEVLRFLSKHLNIDNKHAFFTRFLSLTIKDTFSNLSEYNIYVNHDQLLTLTLYDLAETIIRSFKLVKGNNAYIQFYLDVVLEYTQKHGSNHKEFLEYFERKKSKLSIVSPTGQNAVQVMTIHKSKGLEFSVVIFPYAELDLYRTIDSKVWFNLNSDLYNGFSKTLLSYSKELQYFGEQGEELYNRHQSQLELDNINLLYVTLTRPIEQLYIIGKKDFNTKGQVNLKSYSGLLISYLQQQSLWQDHKNIYEFGDKTKMSQQASTKSNAIELRSFISSPKENHKVKIVTSSGLLWDSKQEEAIEKGNLIHDIMAKIITKNDVQFALNEFLDQSVINEGQKDELHNVINQIISHPELKDYYSDKNTVYNERDIITTNNELMRPDRLIITPNNDVIIIDYKTGDVNEKHKTQLNKYATMLFNMGYTSIKKVLIYINNELAVKEV